MFLQHLILRHFRNYRDAHFTFSPQVNLIQGDNGQGKTNLLEAIHLVSTGRSFRTHALGELISFGASYFYLEAHFVKDEISQQINIYYDQQKVRRVQHNQTAYATLTSLLGVLPSVLLSPDDLSLISGMPAERRRFLDIYIAQTDPLYVHHLGRYYKAMKQRNHLLKAHSEQTISAWEQMMAQAAHYLIQKRKAAVAALQSPLAQWMDILSDQRDQISIAYHCSTPADDDLQNFWRKSRAKEMHLGTTLLGPHRDDLLISLESKRAKAFSSEGQKRSCISALRFAEWVRLQEITGSPPLLGIDDFGLQLDRTRLEQLKGHMSQFKQVFLTSPHPLESEFSTAEHRSFSIEKGQVICFK